MAEALDVVLEFDVSEETASVIEDAVGSQTEYFTGLLAEEFKNAMYEKLLAKGMTGNRSEVLGKWIEQQAADLKETGELYMVPNPIRLKE